MWWKGDKLSRIRPYRKFKGYDLSKQDKVYFSKAKTVINFLCNLSQVEVNVSNSDISFEPLFVNLLQQLYPQSEIEEIDTQKPGDLKYLTIYDKMRNCKLI